MSKLVIALISFFLGGAFGMALMCCISVGKESENKYNKKL